MPYETMNPYDLREQIRLGKFSKPTTGVSLGYAQGNVVIIDKEYAFDFLLFSYRNPKACPILYVSEPGEINLEKVAKDSNIYTDVGKYRVYKNGVLAEECSDVLKYHSDNMVAFIIGCSFTFEAELLKSGISIPHINASRNVSMYNTSIKLEDAGRFRGNTVVSMRAIKAKDISKAVQISSKFSRVHGGPIHIGKPEEIGIMELSKPDYGDYTDIKDDEIPVFWACGVTPQNALMQSKIPFAITHAPGYMFVTDIKNRDIED